MLYNRRKMLSFFLDICIIFAGFCLDSSETELFSYGISHHGICSVTEEETITAHDSVTYELMGVLTNAPFYHSLRRHISADKSLRIDASFLNVLFRLQFLSVFFYVIRYSNPFYQSYFTSILYYIHQKDGKK